MSVSNSKILKSHIQFNKPQKISRNTSIKEFYERRNKILVFRGVGGMGDIFMHRMIFEDMKRLMPDSEIHFACPKIYHDAIIDHPFIDKILDSSTVNRNDYLIHYNTTTACGRTEMKLAPFAGPHRSDIWATTCGFLLTKHEMHIRLTEEEKNEGKKIIEKFRDKEGPSVIICPLSAMPIKNLYESQIVGLVNEIRNLKMFPLGLHHELMKDFMKNNFPCHAEKKIRNWMAILNQADYVVSVDTAAFHCATGMHKPVVGIFTAFDGKVYGQHSKTFELVQKHRDLDCNWTCGPCYNWTACPKTKNQLKPCLTEITSNMIVESLKKLIKRFPVS